MRLISTNIRFENEADGKFNWPNRKHILKDIICNFSPDIIGSQEGREPQLRDFESLLNDYILIDDNREWIAERMYPSLFVSKNIQVIESGDIWLSETPHKPGSNLKGSAFPRVSTWAKIQKNNTLFYIVNIHLDHVKESIRVQQIKILISELSKMMKDKNPLIMMGDFNSGPLDDVRKAIENSSLNLYDPWTELDKNEETSHHSFEGHSSTKGKRIDWFLLDQTLKTKMIDFDKSHEEGIYPSDHYPLKIEISF